MPAVTAASCCELRELKRRARRHRRPRRDHANEKGKIMLEVIRRAGSVATRFAAFRKRRKTLPKPDPRSLLQPLATTMPHSRVPVRPFRAVLVNNP